MLGSLSPTVLQLLAFAAASAILLCGRVRGGGVVGDGDQCVSSSTQRGPAGDPATTRQ